MEKQKTSAWAIVSFAVGAVVGIGAGMMTARACKFKPGRLTSRPATPNSGADTGTPYCAVPEGADICYPE